ncbi:MAG: cadherin domain-containing protein, partial [Rhodocyclaceae bacterium]|nr:cadherin domain-containing protein [Rhodocyclaceae bacterium]
VSITITPVSDQTPVANPDAITVAEGGTATALDSAATSVLANDAGLGDTPVTVSLVTDVTFGSLTLNADGTFSYTHDGTENFSDSFTYRVTDNDGETSDATVSITIVPNNSGAPTITSPNAISVPENTDDVMTVLASDPDVGANLRFAITGGSDAGLFEIDTVSGALRFRNAPDFEQPVDANGDNVYVVDVRVSDGGLSTSQTIFVTVTDANDAPLRIELDGSTVVDGTDTGSGFAVGRLSVVDPDATDIHGYTIVGGADQARFAVGGAAGDLLTIADGRIDGQRQSTYEVVVRVTDGAGATHDERFVISVAAADQPPLFVSAPLDSAVEGVEYRYEVRTVDPDGSAPPSIEAASLPGWLTFVDRGDGTALLVGTPGAAQVGTWQVTLSASDGENATIQSFGVVVLATNHAPTIVSAGGQDNASLEAGTGYGFTTTIFATDPDAGDVLRYAIVGGEDAAAFVLDAATGILRFASPPNPAAPADADGDGVYRVVVQASDSRGAIDSQGLSIRVALGVEVIDESPDGGSIQSPVERTTANPDESPDEEVDEPDGAAAQTEDNAIPAAPLGEATFVFGAASARASQVVSPDAAAETNIRFRVAIGEVSARNGDTNEFEVLSWIARGIETEASALETRQDSASRVDLPDEVVEQLEQAGEDIQFAFEQVALSGIVLTVGAVWWASRIGALVAGVMVSVPAWRSLDPLAVLWEAGEAGDDDDEAVAEDGADESPRQAKGAPSA